MKQRRVTVRIGRLVVPAGVRMRESDVVSAIAAELQTPSKFSQSPRRGSPSHGAASQIARAVQDAIAHIGRGANIE